MRVLITHSYFIRLDAKQWKQQQPYPPLATLYAAAALMRENYEIQFADIQFAHQPQEIGSYIKSFAPNTVVIYDDGFNYLTKMCLTNMRQACMEMIKMAKRAGCKIIVSSSDSTDHPEYYLQAGADYILHGEGEQTLCVLLDYIKANKDASELEGIIYLKNEVAIKNAARTVLKNLDTLAAPAWQLLDFTLYKKAWEKSAGYISINLATTRGCPFKCNWCAKPIYGNRYNSHSVDFIIEQIKLVTQQFGVTHIWFCDDIFGLKPGWISQFADALTDSNLKIKFKIQCRADLLLQGDTIAHLARAGCDEVWIGAESGSQQVLDAMDKGITLAQIAQATYLLKKHGIKPCFFIQFGYPGETREDINKTIDMVHQLQPADIGVSVSYPLPGTPFYERVKAELNSKANWTDSDDLALMFANTYPKEFYKTLQRYLHRRFRALQSKTFVSNQGGYSKHNSFAANALAWPYHRLLQEYYSLKLKQY
ncbi:MAG: radical SAM protein [Bacteroidetes bacterium]|nr:radical SAM protein [Bacteroidota bacterium]